MTRRDLIALGPLLGYAGCSSPPVPKVEQKPPEPVTGLHALYGMYQNARTWAQDLQVVSCISIAITQVKPLPGKVGAWQAVFASSSLGKKRAYTFSVVDASDSLHSGISPDSPVSLGSDTRPFLIAAARTDTDQSLDLAMQHGGEAFSKKYPDVPIGYSLELSRVVNQPVWRVIWGQSVTSSSFSILIDASTGQYLQTLH